MLDRPTFSEHWSRVDKLRPRLRTSVEVQRQVFAGELSYLLHDICTGKSFRIDPPSHRFLALLDGRTVADGWAVHVGKEGDDALTQSEVVALLGQMHEAQLLRADVPPDTATLFATQQRRQRRRYAGFSQLMSVRIPLLNPDVQLDRLSCVLGWLFSRVGAALWLALLLAVVFCLASSNKDLWLGSAYLLAPENWLLLGAAIALAKLVHEIGHGVACKTFGRREGVNCPVRTAGVTLLVFVPAPYVDTTSSWVLRSRWRRAAIGAAGMYFELFLAAAAAIVWSQASPGVVEAFCYNLMFSASVSTLLFNINPLMRFDGYYILSDLLDVPNLNGRSQQATKDWIKSRLLGMSGVAAGSGGLLHDTLLLAYGILAAGYRVLIGISIAAFAWNQLFMIGVFVTIMVIAGMVAPLLRGLTWLLTSPELAHDRGRALARVFVPAAVVFAVVGAVPVPEYARVQGVVEPDEREVVRAPVDGFLVELARDGVDAKAGEPLCTIASPDTVDEHAEFLARRQVLLTSYRDAAASEFASAQALLEQVRWVEDRLDQIDSELRSLVSYAAHDGQWVVDSADVTVGRFVGRGEAIGTLASFDTLLLRMTADQRVGPRVMAHVRPGERVEVRVAGRPDVWIEAEVLRLLPAGQRQLPSAALGLAGGGSLAIDEKAQTLDLATEPFFEIHLAPSRDSQHALLSGQRVVARFDLGYSPLAWQWWRAIRQTLQRRESM